MKEISLEMFEDKLNTMSAEDIIELFPKKIFIINTDYKFWWTENEIGYNNWTENLISFNYKNDFKRAIILMSQRLVEKQYINLTLLF